jgi:hypothetical protein
MQTPCDPSPCPTPPEACCFTNGTCVVALPDDCAAQGGTSQGAGTICEEIACRPPLAGACCLPDHVCIVLSEEECLAQGGLDYLEGVACEPDDPCFGHAVQETTWGSIKSAFR